MKLKSPPARTRGGLFVVRRAGARKGLSDWVGGCPDAVGHLYATKVEAPLAVLRDAVAVDLLHIFQRSTGDDVGVLAVFVEDEDEVVRFHVLS